MPWCGKRLEKEKNFYFSLFQPIEPFSMSLTGNFEQGTLQAFIDPQLAGQPTIVVGGR